MLYHITVAGRTFEVDLASDRVFVDGSRVKVDIGHVEGTDVHSLLLDGASHRVVARRVGPGEWHMHLAGNRYQAEVIDERAHAIQMTGAGAGARSSGPRPVRAPMPGLVVCVEVGEGEVVEAGQGTIIEEAMKMENELRAEGAGTVTRVHVSAGDAVEKDQILIELAVAAGPVV